MEYTRTKEITVSHQKKSDRLMATDSSSRNSSMSVPSKIFSRFQSLFSSNSDSTKLPRNSKTDLKNVDSQTDHGQDTDHSNQAMQIQAVSLETNVKKELPYNESCNLFEPSHNTVEEQNIEVIEYPQNDLKAELPDFARLEPSTELDINSIFNSGSKSENSFSTDYQVSSKHTRDKDSSSCSKCPSDKDLLEIAEVLGCRHEELGIRLGLTQSMIERLKGENPLNLKMQGFKLLKSWFIKKRKQTSLEKLFDEMDQCDIDTYDLRLKFNEI